MVVVTWMRVKAEGGVVGGGAPGFLTFFSPKHVHQSIS